MITSTMQAQKILVIGHRGAKGHVAENTLESIDKAIELQVDMIEIDVYKIKSGELMVFHDETLDRVTNGTGKIEDFTYDELMKFKVEGKYKIPTLQEVIKRIDRKVALNIELKGSNTALEAYKVIADFKKKGWSNADFIISSFRWNELEIFSQQPNPASIAVLTAEAPAKAIEFGKKIHATAINPYYKFMWTDTVKEIHDAGFKIYPWTINEISDINRLIELGVDGIITDYPDRVILKK
ncbi:glycerophosphodiester phosphodiesterase family protein [Flavobacterium sp. NKUCC04_CG]|uniref:glycerophosphodiester phosphodiesterase n=1 Tax=Flavobacterium sp. NKUCC04_CG TaxID=2842121 RepID=UPI002101D9C7|nr:glycerophosphodiester phosphodiesterase family protein [Flavobacterium sp. NKUCC04_CG]